MGTHHSVEFPRLEHPSLPRVFTNPEKGVFSPTPPVFLHTSSLKSAYGPAKKGLRGAPKGCFYKGFPEKGAPPNPPGGNKLRSPVRKKLSPKSSAPYVLGPIQQPPWENVEKKRVKGVTQGALN